MRRNLQKVKWVRITTGVLIKKLHCLSNKKPNCQMSYLAVEKQIICIFVVTCLPVARFCKFKYQKFTYDSLVFELCILDFSQCNS